MPVEITQRQSEALLALDRQAGQHPPLLKPWQYCAPVPRPRQHVGPARFRITSPDGSVRYGTDREYGR